MRVFFPFQCKTCSEPKQITSSSAIYNNPNLIKPIPVKPGENQQQHVARPGQVCSTLVFVRDVNVGLQQTCAQSPVKAGPGAVPECFKVNPQKRGFKLETIIIDNLLFLRRG